MTTNAATGGPAQINASDPLVGSAELLRAVTLEQDGDGWCNSNCMLNISGQVLGGQLAAHCAVAAMSAEKDLEPSALHVLFVDGADPRRHYLVNNHTLREGRRIAHKSVQIEQDGNTLINASVMLRSSTTQAGPHGFAYCGAMPNVESPDALFPRQLGSDDPDPLNREMIASYPFLEIRGPQGYVPGMAVLDGLRDFYWLRIPDSRDLAPINHYALLTLASDFWYTLPIHGLERNGPRLTFSTISLDHAVWFHRRPDCSRWMLVETQGLLVNEGFGMKRATIWSQSGQPIATIMQQALIRG